MPRPVPSIEFTSESKASRCPDRGKACSAAPAPLLAARSFPHPMETAEIIAIGSELLTPHRVDSNSLYLTGQLNSIGIEVDLKVVAGDQETRLEQVARSAVERSPLVIATGGLGPTEDDITRKVFARVLRRQMVLQHDILQTIRDRFRSRGLEMPGNNARQALVPVGARILDNPLGTAPGLWLEKGEGEVVIILLPGVPSEMKAIFEESCLPLLSQRSGGFHLFTRVLRSTGMTESQLDEQIAPIYMPYKNPVTTILSGRGEIQVHLTGRAKSRQEAENLVHEVADRIQVKLGDFIFSTGDQSLEQVVGEFLLRKKETLAVAESCTGGLIAERITRVPGSSRYFMGGVTCYSNPSKVEFTGMPPLLLEMSGAVSAEVAKRLAEGIRDRMGASIGIGVTGVAGPSGGSREKPVGLVHLALAKGDQVEHRECRFSGDRERIRFWASQTALDMVRRRLL